MESIQKFIGPSLAVVSAFSVTAFAAFVVAGSGQMLHSTPYTAIDAAADAKLSTLTAGKGASILDGLVSKVRAKAIDKGGNPVNASLYTAYVDAYLAKVDQLDNDMRKAYGNEYAFIFQYVYPRVRAIRVPAATASANVATATVATATEATVATAIPPWICSWDGTNQINCWTAIKSTSCPSTVPYTPRSRISYKEKMFDTCAPDGTLCYCRYLSSGSFPNVPLSLNTASLYDQSLPMQFLDPVGIGKIVKTVEYTFPASATSSEIRDKKIAMQAEIDGYIRDHSLPMFRAAAWFSQQTICSPGKTQTFYESDAHYIVETGFIRSVVYGHDFLCVEGNYLVRSLNDIRFDYEKKTVKITNRPVSITNGVLNNDSSNSSAFAFSPQIKNENWAYRVTWVNGRNCFMYSTGSPMDKEKFSADFTIPSKLLVFKAIDERNSEASILKCEEYWDETLAFMNKYNDKIFFTNSVHLVSN